MSKKRFIIDCDPGCDDAQAILMALARDDVEVVAITTMSGNTLIENACRNVLRLLKFCGRLDIPVFKGCRTTLKGDLPDGFNYFGVDGLGDATIAGVDPVDMNLIQKEFAPNAIQRIVSEQPGTITFLALGPLVNIALCQHMDPQFSSNLKELLVMGGNYKGMGNTIKIGGAEFNWWTDPESSYFILKNFPKKITLIPFETCKDNAVDWEFYEHLTTMGTERSKLVKSFDRIFVETLKKEKSEKYKVWDQLALAVAIDPEHAVVEAVDVYATVELHGEKTRGQMVIDWWREEEKAPNVHLITKLNKKVCQHLLEAAIKKK